MTSRVPETIGMEAACVRATGEAHCREAVKFGRSEWLQK